MSHFRVNALLLGEGLILVLVSTRDGFEPALINKGTYKT